MSKIPVLRTLILFAFFAGSLFSTSQVNAQSATFSRLIEGDHGGVTLYFYPSTVRVLMKMIVGDEPAEKFSTIKRGRVIYASGDNAKLAAEIRKLTNGENDEGFSTLMQLTNSGTSITVMENAEKNPMTLFFMADDATQYAIEIEGKITPQMIMQLMSADVGAAAAQFGIGPSAFSEDSEEEMQAEPPLEEQQNDPVDE
ncbi:MAG: DUF4252 domain-containing protein [Cryomorphaceae bacterium]|nr:DUF4252 domain-containing protein [Flavobacteriales bacterium]